MFVFGLVYVLFLLILIGGMITLMVFYYKNLQDTLKEVAVHNQQIPPGNVWLMFIPLFNIVYGFILYPKISDSIRLEFEERGHSQPGDYARGIGITMPILSVCGIIPVLGYLAGVANLVLWIVYWVKMSEFKNTLRSLPAVSASGVGTGVKFTASNDLLD